MLPAHRGVGLVQVSTQEWGFRRVTSRLWNLRRLGVCAVAVLGMLSLPAMARPTQATQPGGSCGGAIFEWILLDAETGQVLSEQNADVLTYPASLTKMMTLYLTFEALNQGRIRLDQQLPVSVEAAAHSPSKLGLTPGDSVSVQELILGVVTRSANDAAGVLAEGLGGSEGNFARMMTWKARQLGMQHTWYQNASGLPNPEQRTTARDVARLALAIYHQFPREYRYFSTQEFEFRGQVIHSHNHLLEWYQGADGIKTGFVNASGFNLAASAVRDGHRLLGVIMGGRSARSRDQQMASLLDQGFAVLNSGRPVQSPSEPLVATAQPSAAAPPVAAAPARVQVAAAAPVALPAAVPVQQARTPPVTAAVATTSATAGSGMTSSGDATQKTGFLTHVAANALRHLAPVGKAEAASLPAAARENRESRESREAPAASDNWAVQLGAFKGEAAAEEAARRAGKLAATRGKPPQVLAPDRHDAKRLYRVQLTHFTPKGAQAACAELHRHRMACSIVRPAGTKVASN